eukprot:TRINITY_DN1092_c0_g1_i1.p1 TRINITY_DN1092_c0_g1~~TRINITY_DN1092_c0_g1_i1.p1  ORF type:complete len:371 (-),score=38.26 TRINITY_DN1092_c0_g1_i1:34-1146(-)
MTTVSFFDLSPELIVELFSFLNLTDLTSMSVVQKSWTNIWSFVDALIVRDESKQLFTNIGKCTNLHSLQMLSNEHYIDAKKDLTFFAKLKNLRQLTIASHCENHMIENLDRCTSLGCVTNLRSLVLKDVYFKRELGLRFVTLLTNLQSLELVHLDVDQIDGNDGVDLNVLGEIRSLRHLSLSIVACKHSHGLKFLRRSTQLESLIITENWIEDPETFSKFFTSKHHLTHLETDSPINYLTSRLVHLRSLKAYFFSTDDVSAVAKVTSLRTLNCSGLKPQDYEVVAQMTFLENLTIPRVMPEITVLTRLTSLTVGASPKTFDWISAMTNLRYLSVCTSRPVSDIMHFAPKLTTLKAIDEYRGGEFGYHLSI